MANIRVLLARVISTHILSLEYFQNGSCPLANDLDMTIQYLSNDQDSDVKNYFTWSQNTNEKTSLPPYDQLFRNKLQQVYENISRTNINTTNETSENNSGNNKNNSDLETKNSNFIYNCNELEKIKLINNTASSTSSTEASNTSTVTSNNLIYGTNQGHDDEEEDENENMDQDEDDDDDEDEIIDKTKLNQLKIVNLENESDS